MSNTQKLTGFDKFVNDAEANLSQKMQGKIIKIEEKASKQNKNIKFQFATLVMTAKDENGDDLVIYPTFNATDIIKILKSKQKELTIGDIVEINGFLKQDKKAYEDKNTGEKKRPVNKFRINGISNFKIIEKAQKIDIVLNVEV